MDIKKNQLFTLVLPSIFYCISFNNYFFFSFHSFNFFFLSCKNPARTSFRKCFVFSFLEIWELISFLSFPTYVVQFIRLSSKVVFITFQRIQFEKKIFLNMHCHNLSTEIIFFLSQITQSIVVCNAYQSVFISINTKKC